MRDSEHLMTFGRFFQNDVIMIDIFLVNLRQQDHVHFDLVDVYEMVNWTVRRLD